MKDASPRRVATITLVELGLFLCVPALGYIANMVVDADRWSVSQDETVTYLESGAFTLGLGLIFLGPLISVARFATIRPTPLVSPGEWLWMAEAMTFSFFWALQLVVGMIGYEGFLALILTQVLLALVALVMVGVTLWSCRRADYPAVHWLGIVVVSATATYFLWGVLLDPPII
jgi:hypothetical protein